MKPTNFSRSVTITPNENNKPSFQCGLFSVVSSTDLKDKIMIKVKMYSQIQVPCKDRITGIIETFTVYAEDFAHAKWLLEFDLDMRWIIGYGAM